MTKFAIVLLLLLSTGSCKNTETVETFGQQVAAKIQAENQTLSAKYAVVSIGNSTVDEGSFSIDGEFLLIGRNRYNLNKLIGYKLGGFGDVRVNPALIVYF